MFLHLSVILLTGGHAWLLREGAWLLPGGRAWLFQGGMCGCSGGVCDCSQEGGRAWDTTRYEDTVNERAVPILLEYILVLVKIFIGIRQITFELSLLSKNVVILVI